MKISKRPGEEFLVWLDGEQLSQVTHFNHLGSLMTQDRHCMEDIRSRIARARNAFSNRKELLTKSFSLDLKKRIVKTAIWSTLLYGADSWVLRRDDIRKLESCKMRLRRKILNISWSDKVSNDQVLWRVEEEKSIVSTIDKRPAKSLAGTDITSRRSAPYCNRGKSGRKEASWKTQNGSTGQNQESTNQLQGGHSKGNYKDGPAYGQNTHTVHNILPVKNSRSPYLANY